MNTARHIIVFFFILVILPVTGSAKEMRAAHQSLDPEQQAALTGDLLEQAAAEKKEAQQAARAQYDHIIADKQRLEQAIDDLTTQIQTLEKDNTNIQARLEDHNRRHEALQSDLEESAAVNREFQGVVQANARDLKALLLQSLQSGLVPGRHGFLEPILLGQTFPTMDDVSAMAEKLFTEVITSGQVNITSGTMVDRKGKEREARLLLLGNFTAIYDLDGEIGFLLYSEASQRFFALSRLPSARIQDNIRAYMQGERPDVTMDISRGGALRQLAHQLRLIEQVPHGGALVWPILAILGLAALIVLERLLFFIRKRVNTEALMADLRSHIRDNDWDAAASLLDAKKKKLIPGVLLTAVALKDKTRPEIENALQEAILGRIPAIERFLSTLGMLAAIAPLLGLLGTVTGMINTFHVITYHGTGDPRLMSGGISEALVTTMLGLSVAIPIMLCHTLLSRRVEIQISRMEEKSVAFVNLIFKTRETGQ